MRAKTLQERISQFKSVHSDKYDYSLVTEPIRWDTKIPVICNVHGVFHIMVNNHQRGAGCIECSGTKQKTLSDRLKQAKSVHGDKYDYSKLPLNVKSNSTVTVVCPEHGDFNVTIANHVNHGSGCPSCSNRLPRDYDKFIIQATKVHGDRYGYKYYNDTRGVCKIEIICPEHGEFTQTVGAHLAGKGCQTCGTSSLSLNENAVLYILKSDGIFKVGVSSRFDSRMATLSNKTPFDFKVAYVRFFEKRSQAFEAEADILRSFPSAHLTGFDGATEWLIGDPCV